MAKRGRPSSSATPPSRMVVTGAEVWNNLPNHLLSSEGKALVSMDPELGDDTMRQLIEMSPIQTNIEFYWGNDDVEDNISMVTLSMCINENPSATIAEVIARYSESKNVPFSTVAHAVLEQKRNYGLFRFAQGRLMRWEPQQSVQFNYTMPPVKKRT